tara:strand:+ start:181 stop:597 length:417 start_codon:yes stop_codon:yes gene_type:complete
MSYVSGSTPTVSGYDTQTPKPLPASAFSNATVPTAKIVYEACDSIIINIDTGSVWILPMTHTASIGSTLTDDDAGGTRGDGNKFVKAFTYATGSRVAMATGDNATSPTTLELPIQAQAWSGSDGAGTGNVTFVYRGGL